MEYHQTNLRYQSLSSQSIQKRPSVKLVASKYINPVHNDRRHQLFPHVQKKCNRDSNRNRHPPPSKHLLTSVKFLCPAGQAAPAPPIGPVLGSRGLKAIDFCKEFNARTVQFHPGTPMQVEMVVQRAARTFSFFVKSPPTSWLLLRCAGADKGASQPGTETVGRPVSLKHVYEIAKLKHQVQPQIVL